MTVIQELFNGVGSGVTPTTSNTVFNAITLTSATAVGDTTNLYQGNHSLAVTASTAGTSLALFEIDVTSDTSGNMQMWVKFNALPGAQLQLMSARNASAIVANFGVLASNKFCIQDASGTTVKSFTTTIVTGQWYRITMGVSPGTTTSNGTLTGSYYLDNSGTIASGETAFSSTGSNVGTAVLRVYRYVKSNAAATLSANVAAAGVNSGSLTELGPLAAVPVVLTNNNEGGSNGATPTTTDTGSGNAFNLISTGAGGTIVYSTAAALHGTMGCRLTSASGVQTILRWTGFNASSGVLRSQMRLPSTPSVTNIFAAVYTSTGTTILSASWNAAGQILISDQSGVIFTSTGSIAANASNRYEMSWTIGTTTSNGQVAFAYYSGDSTSPIQTLFTTSTSNLGTANWDRVQFGKVSTSAYATAIDMDDFAAASNTTTFFGVVTSPPTAAFTATPVGTDVVCTDSSTAVSPATIASWAWTFGDSTSSTSQNPTHTYASAGTYTVGLVVTDSNGAVSPQTTHSVTITAPGSSGTYSSITSASGWVPTSGTGTSGVLTVLTDTVGGAPDLTSFAASPNNPAASELDGVLGPLSPPASGQPLIVTVWCDRINSTSGTMAAQVFEGATQRSALTGVAIPVIDTVNGGSGTATSGVIAPTCTVQLVFPYSDISSVVDWNALTLKMQITAS